MGRYCISLGCHLLFTGDKLNPCYAWLEHVYSEFRFLKSFEVQCHIATEYPHPPSQIITCTYCTLVSLFYMNFSPFVEWAYESNERYIEFV